MYIRHVTNLSWANSAMHIGGNTLSKENLTSAVLNILETFRQYRKGHKLDILIICRFEYDPKVAQQLGGILGGMRSIAGQHHFRMRTVRVDDPKVYISKFGETWVYKVELEFMKSFWAANKQKELPL